MVLKYNKDTERYNEFHCGDAFKIKIEGEWKEIRIELNAKGWYMIDNEGGCYYCKDLEGAEIQAD